MNSPGLVILCVGGISQVVGHLCRWGYKEDDEYEEYEEDEGYDEDDEDDEDDEAHRR